MGIKGKQIEMDGMVDDSTIEEATGQFRIKAAGIADSHISGSAAISMSKLALAVTNAQVANGAAIADTKLATISTAGKVQASALELHANTALVDDAGNGLALKANVAGDGLAFAASGGNQVLSVGVDNSSIEINSDALRVKASGITSAMIADGAIVDADINASAAIAVSKLAASAVTVGTTSIGLGASSTTLAGMTAIDFAAGNRTIFGSQADGNILTIGNHANGKVVIKGDLQVDGDTTTVNSTIIQLDDKNLELATGMGDDAAVDGGGITLISSDGNKTFAFAATGDNWASSEHMSIANGKLYKINNAEVLSANGAVKVQAAVAGSGLSHNAGVLSVAGVTSAMITDGTIVDADINASAAIAITKLAAKTISGKDLGTNLDDLTVDNASLALNSGTTFNGGAAKTISIKGGGVKANHIDIAKVQKTLDNSLAGVTVPGESGGTRTITLDGLGSTGSIKFANSQPAERDKALFMLNGVVLKLASQANKVGSDVGDDGDFYFQNASGNSANMEFILNDAIYSGATDELIIYGPVLA